ncbi:MAG TPA: Fic family protein [Ktedonobacteraceae bacterium]|nr:Fic family protein [Ktedonobacteraceae bacterium]
MITDDNKDRKNNSYYHFKAFMIIRSSIVITNDNKGTDRDRAGSYVSQIGGYKAFIPKPLPPDPPIQLDDEMLHLLSQADRELGRLDGASEILPNADLFVAMYVNKEAVLSSQIEGTQASLIDVLAFEANAALPENPQDIEEVINYINALNYGLQRLNTLPLSLRLIREIHGLLLKEVRGADRRPGEFRTIQNWIGNPGGTIKSAKFVPPSPTDMNRALDNLESFVHTEKTIPILLRLGLVHAQFETIHPFLDGNGRMGRLLITFILCSEGILRKPLLYLSYFFKANRLEYYEYLQKIRDEGDWESWLKFFLRGVFEVAQEATTTARNIVQLRERHRNIIATHISNWSGTYQLLEHLYQRPIITVNGAAEVTGLSYANANRLVNKFQEHGLLRKMDKYQRNRRFIYSEYLAMFDDTIPENEGKALSANEEEKTDFPA